MAKFCEQCAWDLGFPRGDARGITTEEDWIAGVAAKVLCEGCGATQVDPEGYCIGGCFGPYQIRGVAHFSPRKEKNL